MNQYIVFKPDQRYFQNQANAIARQSGDSESEIKHVEINCGNGAPRGWVILHTGERVAV